MKKSLPIAISVMGLIFAGCRVTTPEEEQEKPIQRVRIHQTPQGYRVTPKRVDFVGRDGGIIKFSLDGPPGATAFIQFDRRLKMSFEGNEYGELEVPRGNETAEATVVAKEQKFEGPHYYAVRISDGTYAQAENPDPIIVINPPLN